MTTTSTIITLSILSALGFSVASLMPSEPPNGDLPWKDLAGGGAAVLMLAAIIVFLRFLTQDRTARDAERKADREHVEKVVGDCTEATMKVSEQFSSTTMQLVQQIREDSHAARREFTDALRDFNRKPA